MIARRRKIRTTRPVDFRKHARTLGLCQNSWAGIGLFDPPGSYPLPKSQNRRSKNIWNTNSLVSPSWMVVTMIHDQWCDDDENDDDAETRKRCHSVGNRKACPALWMLPRKVWFSQSLSRQQEAAIMLRLWNSAVWMGVATNVWDYQTYSNI